MTINYYNYEVVVVRNYKGQNLVEFLIITGLVVFAALIALTFLGDEIKALFSNSQAKTSAYKPFNWDNKSSKTTTATTTPGTAESTLNGTPKQPIQSCSDGLCTIDYGDFILTGIPEDFSGFMEASGTSGGTDKLASILEQLADQLEETGDNDGADEFRDLANLTHFLADINKSVESNALKCKSESDPLKCMAKKLTLTSPPVPANLTDILPNAESGSLHLASHVSRSLGAVKNSKNRSPSGFEDYKTQVPTAAMLDIFDNIMSNPKYSDSIKNITKELYVNISDVQFNATCGVYAAVASQRIVYPYGVQEYDPLTGSSLDLNRFYISDDLVEITNPKLNTNINLTAGLVCATGGNPDDGSECK